MSLMERLNLQMNGKHLARKILEKYDIVYLFLKEVLNIKGENARTEADKIKLAMNDDTINSLAKFVHNELGLYSLDCDYDINKDKCIDCVRRTKIKSREGN